MTRMSGSLAAVAVAAVLFSCTVAQAGIIGSSTLIKEPAAVPFGSPDAALPAPWVSYRLSLTADGGDVIQAVEANISGQLHQRWTSSNVDGVYDTPTGNSTNQTNGDSHFLAAAGMLFASGPTEDNPATGSPLSGLNDDNTGRGVGTSMSATFGPPGAGLTQMNVAYIVVPKGSEPNLDIRVNVFNPTGDVIGMLDVGDFFQVTPDNLPPMVDMLGPLVGDMSLDPPGPTLVSGLVPATDDNGILSWMFTGVNTGPAGGVLNAPSIDPATGLFSWDVSGSKGGDYTFEVKATDSIGTPGPLSGMNIVKVQVIVPEPATFCLIGLALVGFAGFRRK